MIDLGDEVGTLPASGNAFRQSPSGFVEHGEGRRKAKERDVNACELQGDRKSKELIRISRSVGGCMLFWDYDTQWGADRSRAAGRGQSWGILDFENTERLLQLCSEFQILACFAVVGSAALPGARPYCDADQIRRIHAAGHEIASHSHRHEWLPGLGRKALKETLQDSKDALEQCIGVPVVSFVPPYNQPFDYPQGWSYSLGERRAVPFDRTDLFRLCEALQATGYRFCRVMYAPLTERVADLILPRPLDRLSRLEVISGISCFRLTTKSGFDAPARSLLRRCIESKGQAAFYGHPHSLTLNGPQNEKWFHPFLVELHRFRTRGMIEVLLPRDLLRLTGQ
ncbi:MAG: polysaccharide deacetylase family protein [Acidobacteria bacterium]|nr:polysaccharide deacetylase family protein [Acidobacteriota bacterium]